MNTQELTEQLQSFKKWLIRQGCEILPVNNNEILRFKGRFNVVVFKSGKVSHADANAAWYCFKNNKKWHNSPRSTKRSSSYRKEKSHLIQRDGSLCFYCNKELHDDKTIDHLVELNSGGKNTINNMVLCHYNCNQQVQGWTVIEKVKLACENRCKI